MKTNKVSTVCPYELFEEKIETLDMSIDRFRLPQYNPFTMPGLKQTTKAEEYSSEQSPPSQPSRLGPTAMLKGEWSCDEDVIIEGHFQGKIDSRKHDIQIEKGAEIKADIQGKNITVQGKVTGNITASGKILAAKEARITGDLSAPQIAIQEGVKFKGTIKMLPKTL